MVENNSYIWAKNLGGTGNERTRGISVDSAGNIYASGFFNSTDFLDPSTGEILPNNGGNDIFLSKLDSSGNFLWTKSLGGSGSDIANGMSIDSAGNIYVAGSFDSADFLDPSTGEILPNQGNPDIFLSKLDSNGNFLWTKSLGGSSYDRGEDITVDTAGNVYTTGYFSETVDFDPGEGVDTLIGDIFVSKSDTNGNYLWAKTLTGDFDGDMSIDIDSDGNVYITGSFVDAADFDPGENEFYLFSGHIDVFVLKLDSEGNLVWAKNFESNDDNFNGGYISADSDGNVYITGDFRGTVDFDPSVKDFYLTSKDWEGDIFVSQLDSKGNFVWAQQLGGSQGEGGRDITLDNTGNVYVTGYFGSKNFVDPSTDNFLPKNNSGDIFVYKFNSNGTPVWGKSLGGSGFDNGRNIIVDNAGNVYTSGYFEKTADFDPGVGKVDLTSKGGEDVFISKLGVLLPTYSFGNVNYTPLEGNSTVASNVVEIVRTVDFSVEETVTVTATSGSATPGSDYTSEPYLVSFLAGQTSAFLTLELLGDLVDELDENITLEITGFSGNGTTGTLVSTTLNIIDDDTKGVSIIQTGNSTDIAEGGITDNYTIALTSIPTAPVTITLTPSNPEIDLGQGAGVPIILNFAADATALNPQTVTVTASDDSIFEGNHSSIITHSVSSTDPNYNTPNVPLTVDGIPGNTVTANITDNDIADITLTTSNTLTSESLETATFNIALTSQPTSDVLISLSSNDTTEGSLSTPSVTFTPQNWSSPQTVTVTGVDDLVKDGDINYSIISSVDPSSDAQYTTLTPDTLNLINQDNDSIGINLTTSDTLTSETLETATFNIALTSQPTSDVLVSLNSSNPNEGTVSPTSITFTPNNWSSSQLVTVTGVDDEIQDGDISYSIISSVDPSSDAQYTTLPPETLNLINQDNDSIGINLTPSDTLTSETLETATFNISLNSQPTSDVLVSLNSSNPNEGTVSPTSVTFTPNNWSSSQLVTVTGVDDEIQDGSISYSIIASVDQNSDPQYTQLADQNIAFTNIDNDTANILINPNVLKIIEGNNNNYSIVLTTEPIEPITISFNTDANLKPISDLIFDKSNWNIPQTVLVEVVDNQELEGDRSTTITHQITSSEPSYKGLIISSVSVEIQDNDVLANISINPTNLSLTEGEKNATYQISLSAKPNNPVIINFQTEDPLQPISSLTFDQNNWNQPQTIEVKTVDDAIAESPQTTTISHTLNTTDPQYIGVSIFDIIATVNDNDIPSIKITQSQGSTNITEGGNTDFYEVILTSQPTANVTVKITPDSQSDLGNGEDNPIELTFTPDNWNSPQLVTVTAIDDSLVEDEIHTSTLLHSISSNDNNYNSTTPILIDQVQTNLLTVNITENDKPLPPGTPGIRLIQPVNSTEVWEGFGLDNYKIVLESEPTADVAITINYNNQVKGDQQTLNFTPNNWNIPQIVWMEAIDDLVKEGAQLSLPINHITNSQDSRYNALEKQLSLNLEDNDNIDEIPNTNLNPVIALSSKDNEILASQSDDIIYGREGNDELMGQGGNDMILGQQDADGLMGEAGNDLLIGGNKTDFIDGGIGDDILFGGEGNDRLWGREGNDQLFGELGNDRLDGGEGTDTLTGFLGNDAFVISDSLGTQILNKVDIVTDFKPTEDKIELPFGLTFEQLKITQGTNEWNQDTFIQLKSNGNSLMILQKIAATTLDSGDFI